LDDLFLCGFFDLRLVVFSRLLILLVLMVVGLYLLFRLSLQDRLGLGLNNFSRDFYDLLFDGLGLLGVSHGLVDLGGSL